MKTEEIARFFEDMGYFPYAFGFIGCMLNAALGCLGSFPVYFNKPTLTNFISNFIITCLLILAIYGGFPIVKEHFPAIETTAVQIVICVGVGAGGIPSFKLMWLIACAICKDRFGVNPNDCIKKSDKPSNEQTS